MNGRRRGAVLTAVALAALLGLSGCATIGPDKVPIDRTNYNSAITESWKQQLLLNIVKIRYVEPLFFVDVGDIVAGYTVETGGNLSFTRTWDDPKTLVDTTTFGVGVSGKYTDRPTITYKPMTGAPFRKAVMSPMPLRNVALGIETGVSANFLLNLGVRSINGLNNETLTPQEHQPSAAAFRRVVEIIGQLQVANAVHVRIDAPRKDREERPLLLLGGLKPSAGVTALVKELQALLDLDPAVSEYELVGSPPAQGNRRQIVLQTYSMMQIMAHVAARVELPPEDVASRRAVGNLATPSGGVLPEVAVRCGEVKPSQAFASIKFNDRWFWVDERDLATKRVFSFILLAFTLMEDSRSSPPLQMTIPTQ